MKTNLVTYGDVLDRPHYLMHILIELTKVFRSVRAADYNVICKAEALKSPLLIIQRTVSTSLPPASRTIHCKQTKASKS